MLLALSPLVAISGALQDLAIRATTEKGQVWLMLVVTLHTATLPAGRAMNALERCTRQRFDVSA